MQFFLIEFGLPSRPKGYGRDFLGYKATAAPISWNKFVFPKFCKRADRFEFVLYGVFKFSEEVLPENAAMLKVFEKSGLEVATRRESQTIHVILRLA